MPPQVPPSELLSQEPETDGGNDDARSSPWLVEVLLICEKMAIRHVTSSSETLFAAVETVSE